MNQCWLVTFCPFFFASAATHQQRSQRPHIKQPQSEHDNSSNNNNNGATPSRRHRNNAHPEIVFNAPFDNKATYYMRVINPGTQCIGYAFKTTKPKRISMNPPHGVLRPKGSVNVAISCDAFDPGSEDTKGDRVTVEWTNTPDPAVTVGKAGWMGGEGMVRRKNLPIEYNV